MRMTPAPGVPVVVILTLAVLCWNAPCPAVVRSAFHWLIPTVVVPAVSVELASLNRSDIVASPNFQSVAVVIVVVILPVTDRIIEFAGKSIVLSVVVPPVLSVIDSASIPVTLVPPKKPVVVVLTPVPAPLVESRQRSARLAALSTVDSVIALVRLA